MKILPIPEIFIGSGCLGQLPDTAASLGCRRIMLVTDPGIVKIGLHTAILRSLEDKGIETVLCSDVQPDPSIKLVQKVAEDARRRKIEAVIGLGGGSSIDTAKVAAALSTNPKPVSEYIGTDLLENPGLPIIAVPTTAGTGSEVTPIAILSDEEHQLKKGLVSSKIIPAFAFLDPEITVGLPPKITAVTGMDAMCHAVEAYTSVNASAYSDALALKAIDLISTNILTAFSQGSDLTARENMLLGSLFAGMAFANAGVTAVHAFAYPLGGMFHVPHGLANSLMLPTIIKYNAVGNEPRFAEIGKALTGKAAASAQAAIDWVNDISVKLQLPKNLAAVDIPEDAIEAMAEGAIQITRLLANNPRKIEKADAVSIYREAYNRP